MTYMNGLPSLLVAGSTRTAVPPRPAMRPQHSFGRSRIACATSSCASSGGRRTSGNATARRPHDGPRHRPAAVALGHRGGTAVTAAELPEDPAVEGVLDVVHAIRPEARREVLPAAVADDPDDGAARHPL